MHVPVPAEADSALAAGRPLPRRIRERLAEAGWEQRNGGRLGLWVSVALQRLVGIEDGFVRFVYLCSTAARGPGNREGSFQTPLGWHRIDEKIGDGLPPGAILVDRKFTGKLWTPDRPRDGDLVLTRVLWLRGLEPGVNAGPGIDSHDRYIYIHGTPTEDRLGTPASMGCIRLSNRDVIELYERVGPSTLVLITEW